MTRVNGDSHIKQTKPPEPTRPMLSGADEISLFSRRLQKQCEQHRPEGFSLKGRKIDHRVGGGSSDKATKPIGKTEKIVNRLMVTISSRSPTVVIHQQVAKHVSHPKTHRPHGT